MQLFTDAAELKAINKQINALQEEIGKLKNDIRRYADLNRDAIRDYHEMILGDLEWMLEFWEFCWFDKNKFWEFCIFIQKKFWGKI